MMLRTDKPSRRCAINGRFLAQPMTGVQRYAYEIVSALDAILSTEPDAALAFSLVVPPQTRHPIDLQRIELVRTTFGSGHVWDQITLPRHAADVGLNLANFGPLLARRQIVCIHDANTFVVPDSYSRKFGLAYRTLLPIMGRMAARVATVSQFSADMLVKFGVTRRDKIFIAPNGHEHVLRWDSARARLPILQQLTRPYVLLLGSTAKHKNVDVIIRQADALDAAGIDILVAGGAFSIFASDGPAATRRNVHHLGFVEDDQLAALYEGALCLVFPSKTEGFGIPPLEAMAKGCPVISSNAASLTEVGGDAVLYVAPDDGQGWRDAIIRLSQAPDLRRSLSAQGRKRAELFSWKRSADLYLNELLRLATSRPPPSV